MVTTGQTRDNSDSLVLPSITCRALGNDSDRRWTVRLMEYTYFPGDRVINLIPHTTNDGATVPLYAQGTVTDTDIVRVHVLWDQTGKLSYTTITNLSPAILNKLAS